MPIPERTYIYFLQMHASHMPSSRARIFGKQKVPSGSIKIGFTVNLSQRIKSHERTLPPFNILGVIAWKNAAFSVAKRGDGIEAENLIHHHFAHSRLDKRKGNYKNFEFFKPTKRLLSFIKRNSTSTDNLNTAIEYELEWSKEGENFIALLPVKLFGQSKYELGRRFPCVIHRSGLKIPSSFVKLALKADEDG